ncbi:hypothetical protein [Candidatus Parabeggiatoa sp. HSG14]|uniref:hypothetical protein n=1 Tax=Candidatus Parabeggiatoa sp. HSG14 TaxID=3055593 RepID=UPI0025A72F86|nr:hypothetical protein [Thiotrichales bacterium HSG14]
METQNIETSGIPQSKPEAYITPIYNVSHLVNLEKNASNDTHPDMLYAIARSYDQKSIEQIKGTTARERFLTAKNNSHQY